MKGPNVNGVVVSAKEAVFLKALEEGLPPAAAAARAGYNNPASTARALLLRPHIQDEIARIRERLARELSVSRTQVFKMLQEAYQMAVLKEDPTSMVRVASEINKMCGYYHDPKSRASASIEALEGAMAPDPLSEKSDDELARIAGLDEE